MQMPITAQIGKTHYKTELTLGDHLLIADEPFDLGGQNLGPTPVNILKMALGSCTAITLRMYADRKGWEVEEISVSVDLKTDGRQTVFESKVELKGNLDEVQKQRMLQIAKMCPVHKILSHPVEIETYLG
jgi:putative redox protein